MNNLGVAYLDIENWDEAIKYFKSALKNALYRTPEKAYSSMGYAYYMKGDYKNAEDALREALIRNPVFPLAMYTLGLVYIKIDDEAAAIKEFKRAIGIMPDYIDAHWELAKTYLSLGEKSKALKHFELVAEKDMNKERSSDALRYIERLKY
jgi:Tfp pilus assembly protein PilF